MKREECPFKKGDYVQIKSWDEMEKEFGVSIINTLVGITFPDQFSVLRAFGLYEEICTVDNIIYHYDVKTLENHSILILSTKYGLLQMSPYAVKLVKPPEIFTGEYSIEDDETSKEKQDDTLPEM